MGPNEQRAEPIEQTGQDEGIIDASSLWGNIDPSDLVKVGHGHPEPEITPEEKSEDTEGEASSIEVDTSSTEDLFGGYAEPEPEQPEIPAEAPTKPDEQAEYVEPTEQEVEVPAESVETPTEQMEVQEQQDEQTGQAQEVPTETIEEPADHVEVQGGQAEASVEQGELAEEAPEIVEASARKPGLFSRLFKRPEQKATTPKGPGQKLKLYILVEKYQPNFAEYLEDRGITAQTIRTDIEDIKIDLMTDGGSYRVVVLEQGTGKFTATNMRKEIQDLAGMCDGNTKRLTMFYMRDILKLDLSKRYLGKAASGIQWEVYESIESLVKYLTGTGEVYVCTEDRADDTKTAKMEYNEMLQLLPSGAFATEEESGDSQKKIRLGTQRELNVSEKTAETYKSDESLPEEEYDLSEDWVPGFVMKDL